MKKLFHYLENRFCVPEFAGWMLMMLSGFFFAAATNTLSGWLYVISGVSFALLLISGILPSRVIKDIEVTRSPIEPVSAGEAIAVELTILNAGKSDKSLFEVYDSVPDQLITSYTTNVYDPISSVKIPFIVVEHLATHQKLNWIYTLNTQYRGIFWLKRVDLVSASPFGLFRRRRQVAGKQVEQKLIVYPQVLTLNQCPLIDRIGAEDTPKTYSQRCLSNNANEGVTKALRPYRWGDPTRLIHWRSSAKFGELKIRELEITLSGQDLIIALDTTLGWSDKQFEEAVVAAASLYSYAQAVNLDVKLWTSHGGTVEGTKLVLETLAGVNPSSIDRISLESIARLPNLPLVWLTHRPDSLIDLSNQSRWLLWGQVQGLTETSGLRIEDSELEDRSQQYQGLRLQLQSQVSKVT